MHKKNITTKAFTKSSDSKWTESTKPGTSSDICRSVQTTNWKQCQFSNSRQHPSLLVNTPDDEFKDCVEVPAVEVDDLIDLYLQFGTDHSRTALLTDSRTSISSRDFQLCEANSCTSSESFFSAISNDYYPWLMVKQVGVAGSFPGDGCLHLVAKDDCDLSAVTAADLLELSILMDLESLNDKEPEEKFVEIVKRRYEENSNFQMKRKGVSIYDVNKSSKCGPTGYKSSVSYYTEKCLGHSITGLSTSDQTYREKNERFKIQESINKNRIDLTSPKQSITYKATKKEISENRREEEKHINDAITSFARSLKKFHRVTAQKTSDKIVDHHNRVSTEEHLRTERKKHITNVITEDAVKIELLDNKQLSPRKSQSECDWKVFCHKWTLDHMNVESVPSGILVRESKEEISENYGNQKSLSNNGEVSKIGFTTNEVSTNLISQSNDSSTITTKVRRNTCLNTPLVEESTKGNVGRTSKYVSFTRKSKEDHSEEKSTNTLNSVANQQKASYNLKVTRCGDTPNPISPKEASISVKSMDNGTSIYHDHETPILKKSGKQVQIYEEERSESQKNRPNSEKHYAYNTSVVSNVEYKIDKPEKNKINEKDKYMYNERTNLVSRIEDSGEGCSNFKDPGMVHSRTVTESMTLKKNMDTDQVCSTEKSKYEKTRDFNVSTMREDKERVVKSSFAKKDPQKGVSISSNQNQLSFEMKSREEKLRPRCEDTYTSYDMETSSNANKVEHRHESIHSERKTHSGTDKQKMLTSQYVTESSQLSSSDFSKEESTAGGTKAVSKKLVCSSCKKETFDTKNKPVKEPKTVSVDGSISYSVDKEDTCMMMKQTSPDKENGMYPQTTVSTLTKTRKASRGKDTDSNVYRQEETVNQLVTFDGGTGKSTSQKSSYLSAEGNDKGTFISIDQVTTSSSQPPMLRKSGNQVKITKEEASENRMYHNISEKQNTSAASKAEHTITRSEKALREEREKHVTTTNMVSVIDDGCVSSSEQKHTFLDLAHSCSEAKSTITNEHVDDSSVRGIGESINEILGTEYKDVNVEIFDEEDKHIVKIEFLKEYIDDLSSSEMSSTSGIELKEDVILSRCEDAEKKIEISGVQHSYKSINNNKKIDLGTSKNVVKTSNKTLAPKGATVSTLVNSQKALLSTQGMQENISKFDKGTVKVVSPVEYKKEIHTEKRMTSSVRDAIATIETKCKAERESKTVAVNEHVSFSAGIDEPCIMLKNVSIQVEPIPAKARENKITTETYSNNLRKQSYDLKTTVVEGIGESKTQKSAFSSANATLVERKTRDPTPPPTIKRGHSVKTPTEQITISKKTLKNAQEKYTTTTNLVSESEDADIGSFKQKQAIVGMIQSSSEAESKILDENIDKTVVRHIKDELFGSKYKDTNIGILDYQEEDDHKTKKYVQMGTYSRKNTSFGKRKDIGTNCNLDYESSTSRLETSYESGKNKKTTQSDISKNMFRTSTRISPTQCATNLTISTARKNVYSSQDKEEDFSNLSKGNLKIESTAETTKKLQSDKMLTSSVRDTVRTIESKYKSENVPRTVFANKSASYSMDKDESYMMFKNASIQAEPFSAGAGTSDIDSDFITRKSPVFSVTGNHVCHKSTQLTILSRPGTPEGNFRNQSYQPNTERQFVFNNCVASKVENGIINSESKVSNKEEQYIVRRNRVSYNRTDSEDNSNRRIPSENPSRCSTVSVESEDNEMLTIGYKYTSYKDPETKSANESISFSRDKDESYMMFQNESIEEEPNFTVEKKYDTTKKQNRFVTTQENSNNLKLNTLNNSIRDRRTTKSAFVSIKDIGSDTSVTSDNEVRLRSPSPVIRTSENQSYQQNSRKQGVKYEIRKSEQEKPLPLSTHERKSRNYTSISREENVDTSCDMDTNVGMVEQRYGSIKSEKKAHIQTSKNTGMNKMPLSNCVKDLRSSTSGKFIPSQYEDENSEEVKAFNINKGKRELTMEATEEKGLKSTKKQTLTVNESRYKPNEQMSYSADKEETYLMFKNELLEEEPKMYPQEKMPQNDSHSISPGVYLEEKSDNLVVTFFGGISESIIPKSAFLSAKGNSNSTSVSFDRASTSSNQSAIMKLSSGKKKTPLDQIMSREKKFVCKKCTKSEKVRLIEKKDQGSSGLDFAFNIPKLPKVKKQNVIDGKNLLNNVAHLLNENYIPSMKGVTEQTQISHNDVHDLIHPRTKIRCSLCKRSQ